MELIIGRPLLFYSILFYQKFRERYSGMLTVELLHVSDMSFRVQDTKIQTSRKSFWKY